jgi:hypothetical protein
MTDPATYAKWEVWIYLTICYFIIFFSFCCVNIFDLNCDFDILCNRFKPWMLNFCYWIDDVVIFMFNFYTLFFRRVVLVIFNKEVCHCKSNSDSAHRVAGWGFKDQWGQDSAVRNLSLKFYRLVKDSNCHIILDELGAYAFELIKSLLPSPHNVLIIYMEI